jgi:hypothetical protein
MTSDNELPPRPTNNNERAYSPNAETLPPVDHNNHYEDDRQDSHLGWFTGLFGLSPGLTVGVIFIGSFICGILLTSMILAGIIEIQPHAIKGFFKSIFGKS